MKLKLGYVRQHGLLSYISLNQQVNAEMPLCSEKVTVAVILFKMALRELLALVPSNNILGRR